MYIVYSNGKKHSAWVCLTEALETVRTLRKQGFTANADYDETAHYINGQLF
jgi:glycine cleavage system aminomethyltransferase T